MQRAHTVYNTFGEHESLTTGFEHLIWGHMTNKKDANNMFLTTSICLHFLYLSFLSDASLLKPLSFSWMMASSMGSAEPGLPVKTMKVSQTVWQGMNTVLKAIIHSMTYTLAP